MTLKPFEPCDVRLVRLNGCLVRCQSADRIVAILCRGRTTPQQILLALGRDGRELEIGLGRSKVGAGLAQLLVDFGRVDLGQQSVGREGAVRNLTISKAMCFDGSGALEAAYECETALSSETPRPRFFFNAI